MKTLIFVLTLVTFCTTSVKGQIITTIAGNGNGATTGDGGHAALAQLNHPADGVLDASGNYYFVDYWSYTVRKIDGTTGTISTLASVMYPGGIGLDLGGNILIAQPQNNTVSRINTTTGSVTTIAGYFQGFGGDGGPATSASLYQPTDVAVDGSGNIYIADANNFRIRRVDAVTGFISTIAGTGTSGYSGDSGPAVLADIHQISTIAVNNGSLYLGGGYRVRKIDLTSGIITTIAGIGSGPSSGDGGLATSAAVFPGGIAFDASGNIYIADAYNTVRKITVSTGIISKVAGMNTQSGFSGDGGPATSAQMTWPSGIAIHPNGNITISDGFNNRIRKVWACVTSMTSPVGQIICQNAAATPLTVAAAGSGGFTYQWYSNTVNAGGGGTLISGATGTSYTPPTNTLGTTYYYAAIATACGTVSSLVAPVTINTNISITGHPSTTPLTVCQNAVAGSYTVTAAGSSNVSYQWYRNTTSSNSGGTLIAGATTASYSPATNQAGVYYYYATALGCNLLTSSVSGSVTINPAPTITTQPNQSITNVCQNATAPALTVVAAGTGPLTYQWYSNNVQSNTGGTAISGATSATYTPPTPTSGTFYYYVVVTGACGTIASAVGGNIVVLATSITTHPSTSAQTLCANGSGTALTVSAAGNNVYYEWFRTTTPVNTGGTYVWFGAAYVPTGPAGTFYYYARATGTCGIVNSAVSGAITLTPATSFTTNPSSTSQTVCQNGTPTNLTVAATGTGAITYQWYSNTTPSVTGASLIAGATGTSFNPPTSTPGLLYYYATASSSCGTANSWFSGYVNVVAHYFSNQPLSRQIIQNSVGNIAAFSPGVSPTYQWYSNTVNSNVGGSAIPGATSGVFTLPTSTLGTYYYYVTSTSCGFTITSNAVSVMVILPHVITTTSGTGTAGYSGDNGLAESAQVNGLNDIVADGNGNIYFTQGANHVVRKIDAVTKVVTTFAGNGIQGSTGDGGLATSASLNFSTGSSTVGRLAVDAAGNLYIWDTYNHRVRKVNVTSNIITTLGYLSWDSYGIAADASGNVYAGGLGVIRRMDGVTGAVTVIAGTGVSGFSGDGGPAISATLSYAYGVALDNNNNLYFADASNNRIRKIDLTTGLISTVVGGGSSSSDGIPATTANIFQPWGVTIKGADLYISGYGSHTIRQVDTGSWFITTAAGSSIGFGGDLGPATAAQLYFVRGATVDNHGNLHIADVNNYRIRTVWSCFYTLTSPSTATQNVCQNAAATPLTVAVTGSGSFTYQWYSNATSSNMGGTLISGATGASYVPPSATLGTTYYYAKVTGSCGTITSAVSGPIVIKATPAFTTQPSAAPVTICQFGTFTPALSVAATGTAPLTYQWYSNTANNNTSGTLISGATTTTYTPPTTVANVRYYYAVVTGCTAVPSAPSGAITVTPRTAISVHPATGAVTVCQGTAFVPLTVTAVGTNLTLQWYRNTTASNSGGTLISGATSASYTPPNTAPGTGYFYAIATGTCGPNVTSNVSGARTVNAATGFTVQPSPTPQTVCLNASTTALTVTAVGTGTITYQWYSNAAANNTGGTPISGATTTSYTPPSNTAGVKYYYITATSSCGGTVPSNVSGAITINLLTSITAQPSSTPQTYCQNAATTPLTVTATGTNLTYQWYSNTNASYVSSTLIPGATSPSFTPPSTTVGVTYYYVIVTGACGSVTSSISGAITITPATAITTHPSTSPQTVCQNAATTALTVAAVGTGTITYQWYSNTTASNSGGTSIGGATSTSYTPPSTTAGTKYYYATASSSCGTVTSNVSGAITINPTTAINTHPSTTPQTVCINGTITALSVAASGASLTYQWYYNSSASYSGATLIAGATATSYTPPSSTAGVRYYYVAVAGTCGNQNSNFSGAININSTTTITAHPSTGSQNVCPTGSLTSLSVTATGAGLSYQWFLNTSPSNTGGTLISGATSASYVPPINPYGLRYYYATATGTCGTVTSNVSGSVTINLVAGTITGGGNLCNGPVYLTAGAGYGWSWGSQSMWAYYEGTYSVSYFTANGCEAYAEINIQGQECDPPGGCVVCPRIRTDTEDPLNTQAGEPDLTATHIFGVSPNPTEVNEVLVVLTKHAEEDCPVSVIDQLGRVQVQTVIEKGKREKLVQLGNISDGIYFVMIRDNQRTRSRKLIVRRE